MRFLLLAAALLAPAAPATAAALHAPVQVSVMGFSAELKDGLVIASWKRYKRTDFKSYNLLKSDKDDPQYPDVQPIFIGESKGAIRYKDGNLAPGTWHYRLCILTTFGDRWISPVITVTIKPEDLSRPAPTAADFEGP